MADRYIDMISTTLIACDQDFKLTTFSEVEYLSLSDKVTIAD